MIRCRCGCNEDEHELDEGILKCKNHNEFKCPEFKEGDMCVCGHYKTSHDVLGRCHAYIITEEMCECNDYKKDEKDN